MFSSNTISRNSDVPHKLASWVDPIRKEAANIYGSTAVNEAQGKAMSGTGITGALTSIMGAFGKMIPQQTQKVQEKNNNFFEQMLMLKTLDQKPTQNEPEKNTFFEQMLMMKMLNEQKPNEGIQVQNQAQQAAFMNIQNMLNMSKMQEMMQNAKTKITDNPLNALLYIGLPIAGLILTIALIFKKSK